MTARVLVVEDDSDIREFLQYIFEQEKYTIITAADGKEGLDKARTERPDIVLLDVLLPKMNGFEVCEILRQDPATCLIPIIMVTSLTAVKDRLTGIKLGADEYMSKPFEPVELLARVDRLVERARQNITANPLTGLAGASFLEEDLRRRIKDGDSFTVGLADINHFGAFNLAQGFEKGDGALRLAGTILRSAVTELGNKSDVVVYLGEDNFAFVTTPARAEVVGARVLENFEALLPDLTLSIGLVDAASGKFQHHAQALDQARAALAQAKQKGGNQVSKLA